MQERVSSQVVNLPPMGNTSPEQAAVKGLIHWVWNPYMDINNMGPIEIRSQLGYRDKRWEVIKRCTPYPLGNLVSREADRATAAEMHDSGILSNAHIPQIETVKYAQEQAAELGQMYADEYGLRVLTPLTGMDDSELVLRIVAVVQPFEFAIYEMADEFNIQALKRIEKSNLSNVEKEKAEGVAKIMAHGAVRAEAKALSEYEDLIKSMSDASVGKPGISNPNKHHEWICTMLNKPIPKRINRTEGSENNNDAINILAKRALKEESAAESMAAQLEEEKAARLALEAKLDQIIAQNEKTVKQVRG
jgi:hypothetical protein